MNKYVLIPREQYDRFKEFLLSEQSQNNPKEGNVPQETTSSPQKESFQMSDELTDGNKRSESEQVDLKPEERGKIPPPPGVPATETLNSITINNNNNKIRGKKKQEGHGQRPEWFRYWNKNIR